MHPPPPSASIHNSQHQLRVSMLARERMSTTKCHVPKWTCKHDVLAFEYLVFLRWYIDVSPYRSLSLPKYVFRDANNCDETGEGWGGDGCSHITAILFKCNFRRWRCTAWVHQWFAYCASSMYTQFDDIDTIFNLLNEHRNIVKRKMGKRICLTRNISTASSKSARLHRLNSLKFEFIQHFCIYEFENISIYRLVTSVVASYYDRNGLFSLGALSTHRHRP